MAEEDAQVAANGRTRTSEISAAGKALKLHLPADMTIEQFLALAKDPDMDAKTSERERAIEAIRQSGRSAHAPASPKSPCRNFQQPSTRCWRAIDDIAAVPLPIALAHISRVQSLPFHHRDPFDRMMIAQAIEEGLTIVTRDRSVKAYGVPVLTA